MNLNHKLKLRSIAAATFRRAEQSLIVVFFILLFFASYLPGREFNITIQRDSFSVHCTQSDSSYAFEAADILSRAFDEIVFDLEVDSSSSFKVFIMPTRKSFRDAMQGQLPRWTGAFAVPSQNLMVIKSPRWDHSSNYKQVLVHELTHLVVHNFIGARELPRWIDEGMAIFYSGEDRWKTDVAVSKALATDSVLPLAEIDDVLEYHRAKADLAYQQSFSAVNYLLAIYDIEALRDIIYGLKDGQNIQSAFFHATGSNLDSFEQEWRLYIKKTHRWFWFHEINEYIWGFIFILAVLVFIFRKLRNKRIEKEWEQEFSHSNDSEREQN